MNFVEFRNELVGYRSVGHVNVGIVIRIDMFNRSLEHGVVPSIFKSAYITPLLKKADLDPADVKSYRPISNLSVISKLLERVLSVSSL